MKQSLSFVAAAFAVLAVLILASSSGKKPPVIPRDGLHDGLTRNEACLPCHAPGKQSPLKDTHPPKEQCILCHEHAR
jgi:hypothetical protein